ncbi:rRNA pseudouridine synthase [Candidatus Parcubacteria bacterium]|nr:rRNA pseudouridine synthase [Candidatus Parcubacteria bacterium]
MWIINIIAEINFMSSIGKVWQEYILMTDIILQKFIANAGYCSRRKAEERIRSGQVKVNNKIAELGMKVSSDDKIEIGNKLIELPKEKIYITLNKPVGVTCTNRRFKNEKNVFELLPGEFKNLHVVGRLDKNSRGLVLLTNDGDMTMRMTHPRFGHEKKYVVQLRIKNQELHPSSEHRRIDQIIDNFLKGIDIGDGDGVVKVKKIKYLEKNKFEIILTEGKKRQIRRMFKVLDLDVVDLKRVVIGNIKLGNLKVGKWKELKVGDLGLL